MKPDEIQELKETLFGYFNITIPETDGLHTMLDNYFRNLTPEIAFDALLELGKKELRARSVNDVMNHYREFYRMEKEKKARNKLSKEKVSYQYQVATESYLKLFDVDGRNTGRALQLFQDMIHEKQIFNTTQLSNMQLFESIKNDLVRLINTKEKNGILPIIETDFFLKHRHDY